MVIKANELWLMRENRTDVRAQEMNTQKCESIARLQCEEDQCPHNAVMQPLVSCMKHLKQIMTG